jgi:hypothetical protein
LAEVLVAAQRPVRVVRISRCPTEPPVVVLDERGDEGVGVGHGADALKAELLDESVLQGVIHSLDATLGLWAVRTDDLDVELGQCTPELSDTSVSAGGALLGHAKDAVLVAVKGTGLPWLRRYETVEAK